MFLDFALTYNKLGVIFSYTSVQARNDEPSGRLTTWNHMEDTKGKNVLHKGRKDIGFIL
jgi:hypothetical protein